MTRTVPSPLQIEKIKIQPSLERVNEIGLLDLEIEATSSSSETRLFSFFSPEKRISASVAPAIPQMKTTTEEAINLALITNGYCDPAWMTKN
jgi:hypothetical protein